MIETIFGGKQLKEKFELRIWLNCHLNNDDCTLSSRVSYCSAWTHWMNTCITWIHTLTVVTHASPPLQNATTSHCIRHIHTKFTCKLNVYDRLDTILSLASSPSAHVCENIIVYILLCVCVCCLWVMRQGHISPGSGALQALASLAVSNLGKTMTGLCIDWSALEDRLYSLQCTHPLLPQWLKYEQKEV